MLLVDVSSDRTHKLPEHDGTCAHEDACDDGGGGGDHGYEIDWSGGENVVRDVCGFVGGDDDDDGCCGDKLQHPSHHQVSEVNGVGGGEDGCGVARHWQETAMLCHRRSCGGDGDGGGHDGVESGCWNDGDHDAWSDAAFHCRKNHSSKSGADRDAWCVVNGLNGAGGYACVESEKR